MINKDSKKLEMNVYRSLIGDNIKLFREEKGYSQEELVGLMNISRTNKKAKHRATSCGR